uniref:Uncharacterized protein n=1 Tax=Romanomermis culicivorax TaxID=13658 RepID=A0A915I1N7_ROMCU
MTKIPYFGPNTDPTCYPLLFPYAPQGYKYGILNADPNNEKANDNWTGQFETGKEGGALYTDDNLDWIIYMPRTMVCKKSYMLLGGTPP